MTSEPFVFQVTIGDVNEPPFLIGDYDLSISMQEDNASSFVSPLGKLLIRKLTVVLALNGFSRTNPEMKSLLLIQMKQIPQFGSTQSMELLLSFQLPIQIDMFKGQMHLKYISKIKVGCMTI